MISGESTLHFMRKEKNSTTTTRITYANLASNERTPKKKHTNISCADRLNDSPKKKQALPYSIKTSTTEKWGKTNHQRKEKETTSTCH